jgi:hypothetical protein
MFQNLPYHTNPALTGLIPLLFAAIAVITNNDLCYYHYYQLSMITYFLYYQNYYQCDKATRTEEGRRSMRFQWKTMLI